MVVAADWAAPVVWPGLQESGAWPEPSVWMAMVVMVGMVVQVLTQYFPALTEAMVVLEGKEAAPRELAVPAQEEVEVLGVAVVRA